MSGDSFSNADAGHSNLCHDHRGVGGLPDRVDPRAVRGEHPGTHIRRAPRGELKLNLSFFRRPPFSGSTLVATTTYFAISVFFSVALRLEVVGSASPYPLALDFLPLFGGMVLASLFTGRWVAAVGTRTPMTVGCITADRYEITPVARTKKFTALITLSRVTWSNPHEFSTDS